MEGSIFDLDNILHFAELNIQTIGIFIAIIGGLLGGDNLSTVLSEFFIRWPRNFCVAFFLNILVAGPISRALLNQFQKNNC